METKLVIEPGTLIAAVIVGLLGGVHCAGMCGGIVTALSLGEANRSGASGRGVTDVSWCRLLTYNLGRILSYTLAGAVAGGAGWFAAHMLDVHHAQQFLQLVAGGFMIALGLYLAGWWYGLARVEWVGGFVWRRLEPIGRNFMPIRGPGQALAVGAVWGWLPCGLVYSVLIWSLASGGAMQGAALMAAFGLGTLPNLLLMGVMAARLGVFLGRRWVRAWAGLAVAGFGIFMIWQGIRALYP